MFTEAFQLAEKYGLDRQVIQVHVVREVFWDALLFIIIIIIIYY